MCTKYSGWSVGTIYDPSELPGVSTADPGIGRGVINGIRADPRGFMVWARGFGYMTHGACGPGVVTWHGI